MSEMNGFNTQIMEGRANEGKVGGQFEGAPVLLLTTVGAKSGLTRVNPMMYLAEGERLFVFASKAGAPTNPGWFHNIVADPAVTVEVGSVRFVAVATVLEGDQRDRVYAEQAVRYPGFAEYQAATDWIISVVALDRR
jgi:deazaflavin-dependent oxidoreductase (nitroreductase family)